jgi:hypothetical protein
VWRINRQTLLERFQTIERRDRRLDMRRRRIMPQKHLKVGRHRPLADR